MRYLGLLCLMLIAFATSPAKAQDNAIISRGDAVVTGFSGTKSADPPAAAGDPLDETFIDPDGAAARVMRLDPGAPPAGQLITAPSSLEVKARVVGQVFAITLDDGLTAGVRGTPNIYLGATSAFGLQIVAPDSDGDGRPERLKKGDAKAEWMPGQFGKGGGPGSIYKVDGKTGAVSLFTTIPGNSGPGLGDIVFDSATRQFFVSDLDTGLIHRLDAAGTLIDTFDHGLAGRPAAGLPAVADDGVAMDITSPSFDSENAASWGIAPPDRLVWGLGLRAGRLYYGAVGAAGPEIWSVSINLDGTFGGDPRREIEVSGTPNNHPISDIAFDARDHMYVAQRGGIKGSYDYSVFADAKQSVVFRFAREVPDDPVTSGIWVPIPDEYAVGFPPDHRNTSGGVALGYGYDQAGAIRPGVCDMTLWATGDSLLSSGAPAQDAGAQAETVVHGLQGTELALTRPDNEPPAKSWFVDYDGIGNDPQKQGHVGDVEIWQPCEPGVDTGAYEPAADLPLDYVTPDYVPPDEGWPDGVPPDDVPPGDVPPDGEPDWTYNLRLEKLPVPGACVAGGLGFLCDYVVRVINTGPDPYFGPIVVNDALPAAPVGAVMTPANSPPWFCFPVSPTEQQCTYGPGALLPGESIDLYMTVDLPVAAPVCLLDNQAELDWPWGQGDLDPTDDFDLATATIPAPHCLPPGGGKTNLQVSKQPLKDVCTDKGPFFECPYLITVRNVGAGIYNGLVKVDDTVPAGATATFAPASWACAGPAPTYSCQRGPVVLLPGQAVNLNSVVRVPKNLAGPLQCQAKNEVKITAAAGGTDQNTDPTDDEDDATMVLPGALAQCPNLDPMSNLKLKKTGPDKKCPVAGNKWECNFKITLQNFGKAYTSPIQFLDALPFGSPAGATVSFQPPAGWNCGHVFGTLYQCNSNNPDLSHLEKVEIPATVKIPVAPVAKCEVTNNGQIIKAPGGTLLNSFAGDDASSAKAQLSPAFPQGGGEGICVKSNLKLKKTGPDGPCPVVGGNWECKFNVMVQNFGSPYKAPISIVDGLPFGGPAGATVSFQAPAGWSCGGPLLFPNFYLCKSANPNLAHLGKAEIKVTVKIPVAPLAKCEVTNNAKVVKAQGGSPANTFAGDDASSAKAQLAPVFPMGGGQGICLAANMDQSEPPLTSPEGKESNLSITKTASASQVTPGGQNSKFTITVTNEGPGVFNAPIEVRDTLFDGQIVEPSNGSWSAPWVCEGQSAVGHPEQGICKHPQIALDPGESVVLDMEIEAPNSFVAPSGSEVRCGYKNKAEIMRPAPGSPKNNDAGDDVAFADVKFAPFEKHGKKFCEPGLTSDPGRDRNLTITKTVGACEGTASGQSCPFTITVTNEGPGVHNGPIELRDTLFDGQIVEPSNGSWSPPWVCEGQSASGHPEQGICTHPPVQLDPGESVELTLEIEAPNSFVAPSGSQVRCGYKNKIEILDPAGGTPQNTNAGDDTAFAEAKFEPFEKHGTEFCGLGLTTPPASQACPQGWSRTPIPGKCCPPRSGWDGERCKRDVKPPEEKCPANSVGDYPDCRCKSGYTGTPPNCRKIDVPDKCTGGMERIDGECRCPRGTRFIDGKCRTPSSGPEKTCDVNEVGTYPNCRCAKGFTGTPPNCRPAVCPPGTRGKFPDCRRIDCPANHQWIDGACRCAYPLKWNGKRCVADTPKVCPADSVGQYPNCRCKRGTTGEPGDCRRIVEPKKCPADSVGQYPNCRCKRGTTGEPGNCKRIVEPKRCPADSVGQYPNCRCKRGTEGVPGNCKRIIIEPRRCPDGFRGTPPNCKRIIIEPRRCPDGFRGTPPNCKRIFNEPRRCPDGFRGTPPDCKRIIIDVPRRLCPPGFRGVPPDCKRAGTNPQ